MRIILFVVAFVRWGLAGAQEDSLDKTLENVVVTAQRMHQQAEATPYAVERITRQYLTDLHPRTTPEALQGINGVFVQKTNHGGGSPFIRGLTGNQTLVVIDGIRLNNSTFRYGPNQYLNTIDPYLADRIEVAKGTGSVQYGSDALGGVIHVLSKEPQFTSAPKFHTRVLGKYMTRDMEQTVHADLDYTSKTTALTGGVSYRDFGNLYGGDTTGIQDPSGYREWAFNTKATFLLRPSVQLTVANQLLQQQHVPVYHKVQLENFHLNEMAVQQRSLQYARLQVQQQTPFLKNIELTVSWQQGIEERWIQKNGSALLTQERDKVRTAGITAAVLSEWRNWWTASSGIEAYLDNVRSGRLEVDTDAGFKKEKRGLYPDNGKHNSYSVYSLHQLRFKKLDVNAGLRFNAFSISIADTTVGSVSFHPSALVGNIGLVYHVGARHHLYTNYGTGFRAPNIDDMGTLGVVDFRYELPAYDLRPEKSRNVEVGYRLHAKKLYGGIALYHMKLYDLITRDKLDGQVVNGYQVYQKTNSEHAFVRGVEAEADWKITNKLSLKGGLAYTYGQNKTKEEPLRRIPPLNGRMLSTYQNHKWFAALETLFAQKQDRLAKGDKEDNRIPVGGTPGWQVFNAYAGFKKNFLQCQFGLQNLFNVDYRTHGSGINGVGRSVWVSLSINL